MAGANGRIDEFLERGNQITDTVTGKARIAAQILTEVKLSPSAKSVEVDTIDATTGQIDSVTTIPLTELRVKFLVDWQQLAETDLSTPLYQLRKVAQNYSRLEDILLFRGQGNPPQQLPVAAAGPAGYNPVPGAEIERGHPNKGLTESKRTLFGKQAEIYELVASAYADLEEGGITGPWALVMAADIYDQANRRQVGFQDSPKDRVEDLIKSSVYRTTILAPRTALLIACSATSANGDSSDALASPADRAVSIEPELRYLDRTDNQGRYEFAVVGSLALRIRDTSGIMLLKFL